MPARIITGNPVKTGDPVKTGNPVTMGNHTEMFGLPLVLFVVKTGNPVTMGNHGGLPLQCHCRMWFIDSNH